MWDYRSVVSLLSSLVPSHSGRHSSCWRRPGFHRFQSLLKLLVEENKSEEVEENESEE
ncbi:MAG: hypothetical protein II612_07075 [Prevotella sp.]|nr:hypothetical protein [Prevotella sp.]